MGKLEGKVAFITGAARGQGRSHAIRLAQEGANIIAVDICRQMETVPYPMSTPDDLAETVKEVEALDRRIVAQQADVRDEAGLKAAFVIDVPEPPAGPEPAEWLGVDLGIVNIAADSDGATHCGKTVRAVRCRNRQLRARLQSKETKSAKRLLASRRRKESRFGRDINHCISKALVSKAKDTGRGIKLEDLSRIRERTTVRKAQRADRASWSFYQLREFIAYKAALAGVPVALVDPRNTSRRCPGCGHIDKRNGPDQATFRCKSCGLAGLADIFAARNISGWAAVMLPDAA